MKKETIADSTPSSMVIIIRPALKHVCCEDDPCRAAIYNQLLYCIAWKHRQGKDYWYGSYYEIRTRLLDGSWGQTKIISEINALVEQGFIERRHNPRHNWDKTWQYLFREEQAENFKDVFDKAGLCIKHDVGFASDILDLLKKVGGINGCECEEVDDKQASKLSRVTGTRLQALQSMPYVEYLQSPEWAQKRQKALRFAGFRCQLCNSNERLNVHHRTYERLGQELMGDMITLCNDCHGIFHQNRELAN